MIWEIRVGVGEGMGDSVAAPFAVLSKLCVHLGRQRFGLFCSRAISELYLTAKIHFDVRGVLQLLHEVRRAPAATEFTTKYALTKCAQQARKTNNQMQP